MALEILEEVRQGRAEIGLLRRRELELLKAMNPAKAVECEKDPDKPVGRELIDEQMKKNPEHESMRAWDWRVELLDLNGRACVYRVFNKPDP